MWYGSKDEKSPSGLKFVPPPGAENPAPRVIDPNDSRDRDRDVPPSGTCYQFWKSGTCTFPKCNYDHVAGPNAPSSRPSAAPPPPSRRPLADDRDPDKAPQGTCFRFWRTGECFNKQCSFDHVLGPSALDRGSCPVVPRLDSRYRLPPRFDDRDGDRDMGLRDREYDRGPPPSPPQGRRVNTIRPY